VDLVVIIRVRQRLGSSDDEQGMEQNAPFVGPSKQYEFDCPNVDRSSEGSLLLQAQHVVHGQNRLSINGVDIAGGVPMGGLVTSPVLGSPGFFGCWSAQNLIVPPNALRSAGNVLKI